MEEFIKISTVKKNDLPVLICCDNKREKKNPIILLHRLLEDKESELMLAYYLARQGYFVAVPDLLYHGDSSDSIRKKKKMDFNKFFSEIGRSMELIHNVINLLTKQYDSYLHMDNLGIVGSSYGGMLALTAGYRFAEIQYVVSLCASANWQQLIDRQTFEAFRLFSEDRPVVDSERVRASILVYDPIYHIVEYKDKPVLMMNGALDTTFTYKLVQPFSEKLEMHYTNMKCGEKFQWKKYPHAGHKVTYEMINNLLEWLENLHKGSE